MTLRQCFRLNDEIVGRGGDSAPNSAEIDQGRIGQPFLLRDATANSHLPETPRLANTIGWSWLAVLLKARQPFWPSLSTVGKGPCRWGRSGILCRCQRLWCDRIAT